MRAEPPRRRTRGLLAAILAVALTLLAAACSSGSSGGGSQSLKIITWVNPPAVTAIKKIDAEFQKKYPDIHVQLQTAANVNGPYQTLLQTSVDSGSADIVSTVSPFQALPLKPTKANMSPVQYWSTKGVFAPLNGNSFLNAYTP